MKFQISIKNTNIFNLIKNNLFFSAAQQNMARVTMNRPVGTAQTAKHGRPAAQAQPRAAQPKPKPKDNKPPETIDLSDDDDEDDKDR